MSFENGAVSVLEHLDAAELIDALSTGIVVLDAQLCPVYANMAAQDLLEFSVKQARGRPFTELCESSELELLLRRALASGESLADRELTLSPRSAPRELRIVDATVSTLSGGVTGTHLLVEFSDATQRQRISRESELLAQFGGSRMMLRQLAHEIKNPLGGLRGAAQLLERELATEALRDYTRVIISEADRLTALVDSMHGPMRAPQRTLVNVHEVCEHVRQLLASEAPAAVSIERDYDPSLPSALLDRGQLVQALLNVARNALQAVGERGRITIRTRALSNVTLAGRKHRLVAALQVEDDGPGVPEALRASLFYPLVTGRPSGTGLGLAVAQDIVVRHGGLIEFTSAPRATVFTLHLPLEPP